MSEHLADRLARDPFGDAVRGLAIIGVVCIHGLDSLLPQAAYQSISLYFRWCVPAFIFLTAFYSRTSSSAQPISLAQFCLPRLRRLMWPFAIYSLVYLSLHPAPLSIPLGKLLSTHLSGYGWPGQYYFIILFQLLPILYILSRQHLSAYMVGGMILTGLIIDALAPVAFSKHLFMAKLADRPFWYWLPYVALGLYTAQHRASLVRTASRCPTQVLLALVLAMPLLLVWSGPPDGHNSPYLRPSVLLVSTALLPSLCVLLNRLSVPRWLQFAGRHSLVIFCLNPLFIALARAAMPSMNTMQTFWPLAFALSLAMVAFVMISSLLVGKLLRSIGLPQLAT